MWASRRTSSAAVLLQRCAQQRGGVKVRRGGAAPFQKNTIAFCSVFFSSSSSSSPPAAADSQHPQTAGLLRARNQHRVPHFRPTPWKTYPLSRAAAKVLGAELQLKDLLLSPPSPSRTSEQEEEEQENVTTSGGGGGGGGGERKKKKSRTKHLKKRKKKEITVEETQRALARASGAHSDGLRGLKARDHALICLRLLRAESEAEKVVGSSDKLKLTEVEEFEVSSPSSWRALGLLPSQARELGALLHVVFDEHIGWGREQTLLSPLKEALMAAKAAKHSNEGKIFRSQDYLPRSSFARFVEVALAPFVEVGLRDHAGQQKQVVQWKPEAERRALVREWQNAEEQQRVRVGRSLLGLEVAIRYSDEHLGGVLRAALSSDADHAQFSDDSGNFAGIRDDELPVQLDRDFQTSFQFVGPGAWSMDRSMPPAETVMPPFSDRERQVAAEALASLLSTEVETNTMEEFLAMRKGKRPGPRRPDGSRIIRLVDEKLTSEAVALVKSILTEGREVSMGAAVRVLSACRRSGDEPLRQAGLELFRLLVQTGHHGRASYHEAMQMSNLQQDYELTLRIFSQFPKRSWQPDDFTYALALGAAFGFKVSDETQSSEHGKRILKELVLSGIPIKRRTWQMAVLVAFLLGDTDRRVLDHLRAQHRRIFDPAAPTQVLGDADVARRSGRYLPGRSSVTGAFEERSDEACAKAMLSLETPTREDFRAVLQACARQGWSLRGRAFLECMESFDGREGEILRDAEAYAWVMEACVSDNRTEEVLDLQEQMLSAGIPHNDRTIEHCVRGAAELGISELAVEMAAHAQAHGLRVSEETLGEVLRVCEQNGVAELAIDLFENMRNS